MPDRREHQMHNQVVWGFHLPVMSDTDVKRGGFTVIYRENPSTEQDGKRNNFPLGLTEAPLKAA